MLAKNIQNEMAVTTSELLNVVNEDFFIIKNVIYLIIYFYVHMEN